MKEILLELANNILQGALQVFVPILAAALVSWVIGLAKEVWVKVKTWKYSWVLTEFATIAVRAAEQMKLAEEITNKKEYAINVVTEMLEGAHIKIDLVSISAAVEAAVLEEFNKAKVVTQPTQTDPSNS